MCCGTPSFHRVRRCSREPARQRRRQTFACDARQRLDIQSAGAQINLAAPVRRLQRVAGEVDRQRTLAAQCRREHGVQLSRWRSPLLRSVRFTFERCNGGPGARRSRQASSPSMIAIRPWRNSQCRKFRSGLHPSGAPGRSRRAGNGHPPGARARVKGRDISRLFIWNSRRSSDHHAKLMRTSSNPQRHGLAIRGQYPYVVHLQAGVQSVPIGREL